ncbi:hypothetical protein AALO_G00207610 [Alosa alosa]|uniref:Dynein heavy chain coiled coil stalk domain-containing protein n=1 Tax=Alosa alosa TaxID=278164 RepID=A0AAV6FZM9_9TELE|nr:hypothetical protein AALO_G00207610 [Alosa alosa]
MSAERQAPPPPPRTCTTTSCRACAATCTWRLQPAGEKPPPRIPALGLVVRCTVDWFQRPPRRGRSPPLCPLRALGCTGGGQAELQDHHGTFQDLGGQTHRNFQPLYRRLHGRLQILPVLHQRLLAIYPGRLPAGTLAERQIAGLAKLMEAEVSVSELSKQLALKEQELAVASQKAEGVLQEVTLKAQAAEKVKAQVQKVKDKAQAIVDEIEGDKKVAESKLEAAKPALAAAEAALQTIKPGGYSSWEAAT